MYFGLAAAVVLASLIYAPPAHAYLDAGSISMALQAITAAVAGSMVALGLYWSKFKALFRRDAPRAAPRDEQNASRD